jgi:hypothetical protein
MKNKKINKMKRFQLRNKLDALMVKNQHTSKYGTEIVNELKRRMK